MSDIDYNSIPAALYAPGQYIEFSDVLASQGLQGQPHRILLIGLMYPNWTPNPIVNLTGVAQAQALYGRGSMLALMAEAVFAVQSSIPVDAIALALPAQGNATATSTIALTGPATAAGELALYIDGENVGVAVSSGMTAAQVAAAVVAEIATLPDLPVTAAANGAVVTLTSKFGGLCGNDLDVRLNYYSSDATPAGLGVVIVGMAGGLGAPTVLSAFVAAGDTWYDTIVNPFTDAPNLAALGGELVSRWGPTRQIDGRAIMAMRGSQGTLAAAGAAQNNLSFCTFTAVGPTSPPELAAQAAAQMAASTAADPARPVWTLPLPSVLAPSQAEALTFAERNALLVDGISTIKVEPGGQVIIDRAVTMYQADADGAPSQAFFDITTVTTLSYLRWSERNMVATKYPRSKLADNGTPIAPGQPIVTPKVMAAELVALASQWQTAGLIEDLAGYQAALLSQRDLTNRSRLNALSSPTIISGLAIFADQIQFQE